MPKNYYLPFDHFLFRTPLYSYQTKDKMNECIDTDLFHEALFLASPELVEQKQSGVDKKMAESLYKYFSRSFSRCTPFGLFAGCSVGKIGDTINIRLKPQDQYTRCTRLDMNYICALIQNLEKQPAIQNQLTYYPNDSIYEIAGQMRYVEYFYKGTKRIHQITSVEQSEYIDKILTHSTRGATINTLANSIIDDDITYEEADEFIREMIVSQLLKSELDAQTTGENPLHRLIDQLQKLKDISILPILQQINQLLDDIDSKPLGKSYGLYANIVELVKEIGVGYELKFLFQTDMYKPVEAATLTENFLNDINSLLSFFTKTLILNIYYETNIYTGK